MRKKKCGKRESKNAKIKEKMLEELRLEDTVKRLEGAALEESVAAELEEQARREEEERLRLEAEAKAAVSRLLTHDLDRKE